MSNPAGRPRPTDTTSPRRPVLQIVFWTLIVSLYLLGALALLLKATLGASPEATPTAAPAMEFTITPGTGTPSGAVPDATDTLLPTLTTRPTLFPTLTPSP